ncbi:MAG TPA: ATP-dependent DNA helicase RecG [Pirellulales bacterium]|nr:ATP-dependent DNA helicase RecG [Pirellulales bacterium]
MSQQPETSAEDALATPVQFLKKVGPQRAELLNRLGLHTARDVLFFFPRDYQDLTDVREISELEEDKLVSVFGQIEEIELRSPRPGQSILGVLIRQGSGYLRAIWFNQPFMQNRMREGQNVLLSGKAKLRGMRWEMAHPRIQTIDAEDGQAEGRLLPVYPLTDGLNQGQVRRVVESALEMYVDDVEEVFADDFLAAHQLLPIHDALRAIHFPANHDLQRRGQYRFVYQELLMLQLALVLRRNLRASLGTAPLLTIDAKIDARIRRRFPFELTAGQEEAVKEIAHDMGQAHPMNRLLQGDVGSGKTVVALYSTLLAVAHGHQVAIMAPTEVLARQHARVLGQFLQASQVQTALLAGGIGAGERRRVLEGMSNGDIDVVIGTHALVQSGARFSKLGLVIIDEQHKFGVQQRAVLRQADTQPHYLVMTATPIPRTVTMALFGDLDVTTMRDFPPGRQPVHTYLATKEQRGQWWEFFRNKLQEGRQGYVITPLVEESESWNVTSLAEAFEELANGELEAFRLGLIHGRMSSGEKDQAMNDFHSGTTQVLVGTTVVEVGVDVPNATVMTIEGAERFGLAQLHQLRGRISRGAHPGYCSLFADITSDEAGQRLKAFVGTTDGFELAELDFQLRGPGDLFGTRQHGLPPLRIADLVRDAAIVEVARKDATAMLQDDPGMVQPAMAELRRRVLVRYGHVLDLGDVG